MASHCMQLVHSMYIHTVHLRGDRKSLHKQCKKTSQKALKILNVLKERSKSYFTWIKAKFRYLKLIRRIIIIKKCSCDSKWLYLVTFSKFLCGSAVYVYIPIYTKTTSVCPVSLGYWVCVCVCRSQEKKTNKQTNKQQLLICHWEKTASFVAWEHIRTYYHLLHNSSIYVPIY